MFRQLLYIRLFNIIYVCSKINTVSNRLRTSLSNACSLDVQWVSLSPPPTPAVWTCKVYPISQLCGQDFLFHSMFCMLVFLRRLNCMVACVGGPIFPHDLLFSNVSSMGVSISTASSVDVKMYPSPPSTVWPCMRVFPTSPSRSSMDLGHILLAPLVVWT